MKRFFFLLIILQIVHSCPLNAALSGKHKQLLVTGGMAGISQYFHAQTPLTRFTLWKKPTLFLPIVEPETVPSIYLLGSELVLAGIAVGTLNNLSRSQSVVTLVQLQATVSAETQLAKWLFGRYRPDYLDREKRFQDWLNTTPPDTPEWEAQYHNWQKQLNYGRRSFWSGHSSDATSMMSFLGFLLWNDRTSWNRSSRFWTLGTLTGLAGFVASSRTVDNRHHLSDTLTGSFVGALNAVVFYKLYFKEWPYANSSRPAQIIASQAVGYFSTYFLTRILF